MVQRTDHKSSQITICYFPTPAPNKQYAQKNPGSAKIYNGLAQDSGLSLDTRGCSTYARARARPLSTIHTYGSLATGTNEYDPRGRRIPVIRPPEIGRVIAPMPSHSRRLTFVANVSRARLPFTRAASRIGARWAQEYSNAELVHVVQWIPSPAPSSSGIG